MTCMMTTGPVHHGNQNLVTLHLPFLLNLLPQVSHFMGIPEAQKQRLIGEVKKKDNLSYSCPSLTGWYLECWMANPCNSGWPDTVLNIPTVGHRL